MFLQHPAAAWGLGTAGVGKPPLAPRATALRPLKAVPKRQRSSGSNSIDDEGNITADSTQPAAPQQPPQRRHSSSTEDHTTTNSSAAAPGPQGSRSGTRKQRQQQQHQQWRQPRLHASTAELDGETVGQLVPAVAALDAALKLQQQLQEALAASKNSTLQQQQQEQQQQPQQATQQQGARPRASQGSYKQQRQQQQQQQQHVGWAQDEGGGAYQAQQRQAGHNHQQQPWRPQQQQQHPSKPHPQQRQQRGWQQQRQREEPLLLFQGGQPSQPPPPAAAAAAAPDPAAIAGMLTGKLSAAASIPDLIEMTLQYMNALTPVHVAAAVSRAAKLAGSSSSSGNRQYQQQQQYSTPQQLLPWLERLLPRFMLQMRTAGPTELSCLVGGLARLGVSGARNNVIRDVTLACLEASLAALGDQQQLDNKLLLQLAWGTARLTVMPPASWLQAFEVVSLHRMTTFNNIETANLVWVFAKWGVPPSSSWLAAYSSQLQAQLLMLQPPELCSVLWAATMLQLKLPNPVLDALLLEAQVKFVGFSGQALGTLSWSLARMDVKPKAIWLESFMRYSQQQLPALATARRDQPFTNIIWALACWEYVPPKPWLQEFCRCVIPQLPHMPPHSLAILAVSLAELHHTPPQEFTSYLLELMHQRAMAAAAAAAAATAAAGAAAGSGDSVSGSSVAVAAASGSSKTGKGSSLMSHAASFLWALPRLLLGRTHTQAAAATAAAGEAAAAGQQQGKQGRQQQQQQLAGVSKAWMRQYCWLLQDLCDLVLPGLEKLSVVELVDVAAGLADVGFFPGVPWMDAHESALNRQLDALSDAQLAIIKAAYATLEQLQQQQAAVLLPEQHQVLLKQQAAAGALMRYSSSTNLAAAAAAASAAAAAEGGGGADGGPAGTQQPDRRMQRWKQQQQQPQYGEGAGLPKWIQEVDGSSSGSNGGRRGVREDKKSRTGRLKGRPNKGFLAARRRENEAAAVEQAIEDLTAGGSNVGNGGSNGGFGGSNGGGYSGRQGSGLAGVFEQAGWDVGLGLEAVVGPKRDHWAPKQKPPKSRASRIRLQKIREQERQQWEQRDERQQQLAAQLEGVRVWQTRQQERERGPFEQGGSSDPQWSWVRDSDF